MQIGGITQPTALHDMMSDSAGYQVIAVSIRPLYEELRHAIAYRSPLNMLAQCPPAVVVHLPEVLLRTVKQGDIVTHPCR